MFWLLRVCLVFLNKREFLMILEFIWVESRVIVYLCIIMRIEWRIWSCKEGFGSIVLFVNIWL